jgi:dihydrofolate reductase
MGPIVVFENVSLDGVTQDPTGAESFNPKDWRDRLDSADREQWDKLILDDVLGAQALLFGRRTYEFFAAAYPHRVGALADRMNTLPKFVVSATLSDPDWNNSTVLDGDIVDEVRKLKLAFNGEIRVYASSKLVQMLVEHDLVDELRLLIFPLVMGAGNRLFDQPINPKPVRQKPLRLVDMRTVGKSLIHLTYQCIRDARDSAS